MKCAYIDCTRQALELHTKGMHVVLCLKHWKVLIDEIRKKFKGLNI